MLETIRWEAFGVTRSPAPVPWPFFLTWPRKVFHFGDLPVTMLRQDQLGGTLSEG